MSSAATGPTDCPASRATTTVGQPAASRTAIAGSTLATGGPRIGGFGLSGGGNFLKTRAARRGDGRCRLWQCPTCMKCFRSIREPNRT